MKLWLITLFLQLWENVIVSFSWNATRCELHLPPLHGTAYHPQRKNLFLPGETVQVSCEEKFWILNTKTTMANIICKDDGKWNINPICHEVRCPISLQDEHLSHGFSTWSGNSLGDTISYACKLGYKRTDGVSYATCTRNGWTPKPLCQAINCELHLPPLLGTTYHPQNKNQFLPKETVQVKCGKKHYILDKKTTMTNVTCEEDGEWNIKPICQEATCLPFLQDEHLYHHDNSSWTNELGSTVRYSCRKGFKRTDGVLYATCTRDGWTPKSLCQAISCELHLPPLLGTTYHPQNKNQFLHGEMVQVSCGEKFWILNTQTTMANITCKDGEWDIRPICQEVRCPGDPPEEHMYEGVRAWWQNKLGDTVSYSCKKGYKRTGGASYAMCTRDGWTPKPFCQEKHLMNHGALGN